MHQKRSDVAVTKTKGSVVVRPPCNRLRRELRHEDTNLKGRGPESDTVSEVLDVELMSI